MAGPGRRRPRGWPGKNTPRLVTSRSATDDAINQIVYPSLVTGWANPWGSAFPSDLRTWLQNPLPLRTAVAPPFSQQDWPNPVTRPTRVELLTWIASTRPTTPDMMPSLVTGWANPWTVTPSVDLRTWLQSASPALQAGAATVPIRPIEWANPARPAVRVELLTWTGRAQLGPPPFVQSDWPVPRGAAYPNELRSWIQRFQQPDATTYLPSVAVGWSNPIGPAFPSDLRSWLQRPSLALTAIPPGPTKQTDWPNPRGPAFPIDLRTWLNGLPPIQYVFRDPLITRIWAKDFPSDLRTWTQNPLPIRTTTPDTTVYLPSGVVGWSNPIGATFPADLRTFLQPPSLALTTPVGPAPFSQSDWPNPRAAAYPSDLRTWSNRFAAQLASIGPTPFSQTDWPNPRGATPASELRTWIQQRPTQAPPFAQTDWPVPAGAAFASQLRTWIQQQPTTLFPPAPPFSQTSWPVPNGPQFASDLRTWIQRQPQALFPPPAPPPIRQYDWPNPKGPQYPADLRNWTVNFRQVEPAPQPPTPPVIPGTPYPIGGDYWHRRHRSKPVRKCRWLTIDGVLTEICRYTKTEVPARVRSEALDLIEDSAGVYEPLFEAVRVEEATNGNARKRAAATMLLHAIHAAIIDAEDEDFLLMM